MKQSARVLAVLVGLAGLVEGCYDPLETPHCFEDGAVTGSATDSDVCCSMSDPNQGNATCREYYRENVSYSGTGVAELATCVAPGVCNIPCAADSCQCVVNRDCRTSNVCIAVSQAQHPGSCEQRGLSADAVNCTLCAECSVDGSLPDLSCPAGQTCEEVTGGFGLCVP